MKNLWLSQIKECYLVTIKDIADYYLSKCILFFVFFILNLLGVILVHKTIQVSSIQLNKTSVYCIVCPSLQTKFISVSNYPPFAFFYLPPPPFPLDITILLSVSMWDMHIYFLLNPFTFIHPPFNPPSPLTVVSLFYVSVFLFYLLNSFVHYIPRISEIIWYLSFSG